MSMTEELLSRTVTTGAFARAILVSYPPFPRYVPRLLSELSPHYSLKKLALTS